MTNDLPTHQGFQSLLDSRLKAKLQQLRRIDNHTNFLYLFITWLYLGLVLAGTIAFYHYQATSGLSFWWNVPVTFVAIVLMGAGQHQLTGLAHEAAHHILFKNRLLNDLIADWFCMFPMFGCIQHYRLQHLAHHQFVNDPDRDPDVSQLRSSGHWLDFPVSRHTFLKAMAMQLVWLPNLFNFIRIRAKYNTFGTDKNPYIKKGWRHNKTTGRVGVLYLVSLIVTLAVLVWLGNPWLLLTVPLGIYAGVLLFYCLVPEHFYYQSRLHPTVSMRHMTLMRITFYAILFCTLAWLTWATGYPWWLYFVLLWGLPIFTSFAFFMIMRQVIQHGNGGRDWLSNTRVFFVHPLIHLAIFPFGQHYHLPHHLFASIPHYRLKKLHQLLMDCAEYRNHAVVVKGYLKEPKQPTHEPSVVYVLGPQFHRQVQDVYIDNSVLDDVDVDERDEILLEGEKEKQRWNEERRHVHEAF